MCGTGYLATSSEAAGYITPVPHMLRAQISGEYYTEPASMNKTSFSSSLGVPFGSSRSWFISEFPQQLCPVSLFRWGSHYLFPKAGTEPESSQSLFPK
jgi:hypothetical protein